MLKETPSEGNAHPNFKGYLLSGAAIVIREVLRDSTPRGGGKFEGIGSILLRDLFVIVQDFHLVNNLSTDRLA